ncbi:MAG: triosephosphate isomerase [Bacilli bacterium]|nr:triosephosphate isomerase [Bacilli bacterium]
MIIALNNKSNLNKEEFLKYQEELATVNCNSTMILCASPLNIANYNLTNCYWGAQNVSTESVGAHTGEIAASQLKSYGVKYCIVGHSERRQDQKETNEDIAKKIKNLYAEGITPILCVGETKEERESGKLNAIIKEEILVATENLTSEEKDNLIVAYEPIWSIGTGLIPTNDEIEEVFKLINSLLPTTKVLYGGSANDKNIDELKKCSLIEGYLLGGLSLKPENLKVFIEKLEN